MPPAGFAAKAESEREGHRRAEDERYPKAAAEEERRTKGK